MADGRPSRGAGDAAPQLAGGPSDAERRAPRAPHLAPGLRRVPHVQVLRCVLHLVIGLVTQILGFRGDFF